MRVWREVVDGVEVEVMEFDDTVESVEKASRLSGYPPQMIAKTLLLRVGNDYVVAIVRGDKRVDLNKASQILGSRTRLASPDEVRQVLGFEVGAVTPISPSIKRFRVVLDPTILGNEYIVCGGGALNRLYRVRVQGLLNYLKPQVIDIFK